MSRFLTHINRNTAVVFAVLTTCTDIASKLQKLNQISMLLIATDKYLNCRAVRSLLPAYGSLRRECTTLFIEWITTQAPAGYNALIMMRSMHLLSRLSSCYFQKWQMWLKISPHWFTCKTVFIKGITCWCTYNSGENRGHKTKVVMLCENWLCLSLIFSSKLQIAIFIRQRKVHARIVFCSFVHLEIEMYKF